MTKFKIAQLTERAREELSAMCDDVLEFSFDDGAGLACDVSYAENRITVIRSPHIDENGQLTLPPEWIA